MTARAFAPLLTTSMIIVAFAMSCAPKRPASEIQAQDAPPRHGRTIVIKDDLTDRQSNEVLGVLRDIDRLIEPTLQPPNTGTVFLHFDNEEPHFETELNELHVSFRKYWKGAVKHPIHAKSVTAHEYGHALFAKNLPEVGLKVGSPAGAAIHRARKNLEENASSVAQARVGIDKLLSEKASIRKLDPDKLSESEIKKYESRWKEIQAELEEHRRVLLAFRSPLSVMEGVLDPYDEFFADVVAVLFKRDLNAISDALRRSGRDVGPGFKLRSFDANRARAFGRNEKLALYLMHHYFSPTRVFYGRYYLEQLVERSDTDTGKALEKMLISILIALEQYGLEGIFSEGKAPPNWEYLDLHSTNDTLKKAIDCVHTPKGLSPKQLFANCRKIADVPLVIDTD